jgi:2-polyprenyl-3-methyl-5-hydroxy-6-metoxy-1,4-benzoquinol methylase
MAIVRDPEGHETASLQALLDFKGRDVLEIGCGEGRLTWRYAAQAAHVTAIDPLSGDIETARAQLPASLEGRVRFVASTLEDFAADSPKHKFDIAIFSWSL